MNMYDNPALIVISACIVMFVFMTGVGVITKIMINKLFKKFDDANDLAKTVAEDKFNELKDKIEKFDLRQRAQIFALKNMNSEWTGFSSSFSKAYRGRHERLTINPNLEDD